MSYLLYFYTLYFYKRVLVYHDLRITQNIRKRSINSSTFWYTNACFIVTELDERWVENVRNTVVSSCRITPNPCCSSFPVWLVHWTAVNRMYVKGIVVCRLRRSNRYLGTLFFFIFEIPLMLARIVFLKILFEISYWIVSAFIIKIFSVCQLHFVPINWMVQCFY